MGSKVVFFGYFLSASYQYAKLGPMKTPNNQLAQIALVVDDYDRAVDFYTRILGFDLVEDTLINEEKRWVVVRPQGGGCALLLARAANPHQATRVGDQTGGRVFLFLHTDDFEVVFERLITHEVKIVRPPSQEDFGRVCVFEDLYGNLWDLIEPKASIG